MSLCSPSEHSVHVWQNLIFYIPDLLNKEVWINKLKETWLDPNNIQVFESKKEEL